MSSLNNHFERSGGDGHAGGADDASIMERNAKIDDMRARLESQMNKMMGGSDLVQLTKQVEQLRTSTPAAAAAVPTAPTTKPRRRGSAGQYAKQLSERTTETNGDIVFRTKEEEMDVQDLNAVYPQEHSMDNLFQHNDNNQSVSKVNTSQRKVTTNNGGGPTRLRQINLDDEDEEEDITWEPFSASGSPTSKQSKSSSSRKSNNNKKSSPTLMQEQDFRQVDGNPDTTYVTQVELTDPYGDTGSYTGNVLLAEHMPHGLGTMHYSDGRKYQGQWTKGQWDGPGVAVFSNGDRFEGTYSLDRRHGHGRYYWNDGRRYEGEFREDQRHGVGEYQWPDGAVYRGEFVAGHRHGQGTYLFADGSEYTGEWQDGKYHGVGQCTWKDGRVYKGEWVCGQAHGYGVEHRSNGTVRHEGMWAKDHPVRNNGQRRR
mmetsp:Transcript_30846/g.45718  ORF Transcript_30846/g.45718 Transcript_30846/m.45718 type:complete len:427 (-) Transcript_30846:233-1513(-)|eukprot:CAMPEP_0194035578 /NCGR_PEP_ID=MMETSP0009_2-20130614/7979_1 /TAXON_ID=210454 /ORGANISM="Grammatophora oceanica, Strain CCMP 410" /LENGTH=426 /DNA_ID=CAMNT_0038676979 /DNA_START=212 /DNA_END=1492 /DNA_ORIENTATION=-